VKGQRIVLSDAAVSDMLEQADWYESQADHRLAERWEKAVTATLLRIVKAPRSGPLCRFKTDELLDAHVGYRISQAPNFLQISRQGIVHSSRRPWRS